MMIDDNSKYAQNATANRLNIDSRIVDIRSDKKGLSLLELTRSSLQNPRNEADPPNFPDLLLWDEEGLRLFEAVTYLKEYYLTQTELEILEQKSFEMAQKIKTNSVIIDLGSG